MKKTTPIHKFEFLIESIQIELSHFKGLIFLINSKQNNLPCLTSFQGFILKN